MTFDQLEVMEMIAIKGSFKAAAKQLRRTQPTMSVAIKKLEAEIGFDLFDRSEYRPKLTERGQLFFKWAQECLTSFRQLAAIGQQLGQQQIEPALTFVIDPLASFAKLSRLFRSCLPENYPTELVFRTEVLGIGERLLAEGNVDFAIASRSGESAQIESLPFETIEMIPVITRSYLTEVDELDKARLRKIPQIIVSSNKQTPHDASGHMGAFKGGRHCFVTDHALKRDLIFGGYGWGRLASHEVESHIEQGRLLQIPSEVAESLTISLFIMRNKLQPLGPVARVIWKDMLQLQTDRR